MTTFVCLALRVDSIIFVFFNIIIIYIELKFKKKREEERGWMRSDANLLYLFLPFYVECFFNVCCAGQNGKTPASPRPANKPFGRVYSVSVSVLPCLTCCV
jgi:hypothetical protein